jgi:hypothetical protein
VNGAGPVLINQDGSALGAFVFKSPAPSHFKRKNNGTHAPMRDQVSNMNFGLVKSPMMGYRSKFGDSNSKILG